MSQKQRKLDLLFTGRKKTQNTKSKLFYPNFISKEKMIHDFDNRKNIGEIIVALRIYFIENGFSKIKLSVSLKNWNFIEFWQKCRFDKITMVDIRDDYGCLELEWLL